MSVTVGFATIDPNTGNGNQVVKVTGTPNTGRSARTVTATVQTTGVGTPVQKALTINQAGATEFVTIDETATVPKEGGAITINGTTNSTKLTFTLAESQTLTLTLPETYKANSADTTNGTEIAGDPGNSASFAFTITFTDIPANATVGDLTTTLTVAAAGGQSDTCAITQTAGDPTLTIDPETIELDVNGTEQQFDITSNTTWEIVQAMAARLKKVFKK